VQFFHHLGASTKLGLGCALHVCPNAHEPVYTAGALIFPLALGQTLWLPCSRTLPSPSPDLCLEGGITPHPSPRLPPSAPKGKEVGWPHVHLPRQSQQCGETRWGQGCGDRETQSWERSKIRAPPPPSPGFLLSFENREIRDWGGRGLVPTQPACQSSGFLPSLARKFSLN
jgi:hypothetical protein